MRSLSLKTRIALLVGGLVTASWIIASIVTVQLLFHEVSEVFDRDLRSSAERLLSVILHEAFDEDEPHSRDIERESEDLDDLEFIVSDPRTGLLVRSENAEPIVFPTLPGFSQDDTYRFYVEKARRGDAYIAVARPLSVKRELAISATMALILPLVVVIPATLAGLWILVSRGLRPIAAVQQQIASRGPKDLRPIPTDNLAAELRPLVEDMNRMLARVEAGFAAERNFASNAAHELRTPVAGAIAQAQRLRVESREPAVIARAQEIEATLKRLNRYSEKLMQMARAEGARLRLGDQMDIRDVAEIIVQDFTRADPAHQIHLNLPDAPVMTDLDPDAFGIVMRNLVENALRYRTSGTAINVVLDGHILTVTNDCPALSVDTLAHLSQRFIRGGGAGDGAGLGLSIIHIIAERSGANLTLTSPALGDQGFAAQFTF